MVLIRVVRIAGVASVQDLGRPGLRHQGIPPGGALVPADLLAGNAQLGNPPNAAGIEFIGRLTLGLPDGREATWVAPAGVGTLAVPGGVCTPAVLGGRGVSWSAGIGRPLAAGDTLPVGGTGDPSLHLWVPLDEPIAVLGASPSLCAGPWRVLPASDRVGHRLAGPPMPPVEAGRSTPMTRGAIQQNPDGTITVLGPDHPITGGYPLVGVLPTALFGRLGGALPGACVRFVAGGAA